MAFRRSSYKYSRYEAIDLSSAAVSDSSKSLWMISPPELKKLINFLSDKQPTVVITLDYSVRRSEGRYETASGSIERPLTESEVQNLKGKCATVVCQPIIFINVFQNIYRIKLNQIQIRQVVRLQ